MGDNMVELNFIIAHVLFADLAHLSIALQYLKHDVSWDSPLNPPTFFGFSESLR
jgi:hypothetical protein